MRRWDRWLPQAVAALVTVAGLAPSLASTTAGDDAASAVPTSHYVVLSGDNEAADALGYQSGCTDGRVGRTGLRVLFFGTQEKDGRIRPPGTVVATPAIRVGPDWVAHAAAGWIRGFTQCGQANAVLALGVNNKSDGGADPATAGTAWARLVNQVGAAAPPSRVAVTGALDGEPSWSPASWATSWVKAYTSASNRLLYAANSADGCPTAGQAETCSNGWTVGDVYQVSTGAAPSVVALPQIYRTDGTQARQWGYISQWGVQHGGGPLRVVGALSQQAACRQQPGCARTDNSPDAARQQLSQALDNGPTTSHDTTLVSTDVDWLRPTDPR